MTVLPSEFVPGPVALSPGVIEPGHPITATVEVEPGLIDLERYHVMLCFYLEFEGDLLDAGESVEIDQFGDAFALFRPSPDAELCLRSPEDNDGIRSFANQRKDVSVHVASGSVQLKAMRTVTARTPREESTRALLDAPRSRLAGDDSLAAELRAGDLSSELPGDLTRLCLQASFTADSLDPGETLEAEGLGRLRLDGRWTASRCVGRDENPRLFDDIAGGTYTFQLRFRGLAVQFSEIVVQVFVAQPPPWQDPPCQPSGPCRSTSR